MTTQQNDAVVIEADGLARVCAWCVPAKRLAEIHRQVRCSDGLCASCKATLDQELDTPSEAEPGRTPLRLLLALLALLVVVSACGGSPTTPTAIVSAPALREIGYAINIPSPTIAAALQRAYPTGVRVPPVQAQIQWDYTSAYGGSPNVYFGEIGPRCEYPGVGIVVAPLTAATVDRFTAADWPMLEAGVTYTWIGRFVYTAAAAPGTFSYDPTGASCSSPRK